jgi:hypothetical protein
MAVSAALTRIALGWLFLGQIAILWLWYRGASRGRGPFAARLDQLLVLLLSERTPSNGATTGGQLVSQTIHRLSLLSGFRGHARRWRGPLEAVRAQGEQIASELARPTACVANGPRLVRESVAILTAERVRRGARMSAMTDPVVVLAYGLGSWPPEADLTSLEQLLGELGMSQGDLRNRFDSLIGTSAPASQSPAFAELAAAAFVLGASGHILEAAAGSDFTLPASSAAQIEPTSHTAVDHKERP